MGCIFLEFLEPGPLQNIISMQSTYINDAVLIYPRYTNLLNILDKIKKANIIYMEKNTTNILTFLDIMLHHVDRSLVFTQNELIKII